MIVQDKKMYSETIVHISGETGLNNCQNEIIENINSKNGYRIPKEKRCSEPLLHKDKEKDQTEKNKNLPGGNISKTWKIHVYQHVYQEIKHKSSTCTDPKSLMKNIK